MAERVASPGVHKSKTMYMTWQVVVKVQKNYKFVFELEMGTLAVLLPPISFA